MNNKIPQKIHQIWFDLKNTPNVPKFYESNINSLKDKNKDWEYKLWSLKDALELIEKDYPAYLEPFNNFKYPISKCDFFRYILMHKYGGFYIDLDFYCDKSLDIFLESVNYKAVDSVNECKGNVSVILSEEWPNSSRENMIGSTKTLHNGILVSKPNHVFWIILMDTCLHKSKSIDGDYTTVFDISGTRLLYNVSKKYLNVFDDILIVQNYYFCPIGMTKNKDNSNNDFIIGYPNQNFTLEKIINKDSEWWMIPSNYYYEKSEFMKTILPWSFLILMSTDLDIKRWQDNEY